MQLTRTTSAAVSKQIDSKELFQAITQKDIKLVVLLERNLRPATAFGKPALSSYKRESEDVLYANLETLLIRLSMSFNLGKNLEPWQISEIATDVYQKYYFLSIEEFILVLKKGRTGDFGKVYDRLDGAIIMEWFDKYETSEERQSLVEQRRIAQERQDKQESEKSLLNIFQHPAMRELVRTLKENFQAPEKQNSEQDYHQFKADYLKTKILNQQREDESKVLENPQSDFP